MKIWALIAVAIGTLHLSSSINQSNNQDYTCGYAYGLGHYAGCIDGECFTIYYLNMTSERLSAEGYNITVQEMNKDSIKKFTAQNATDTVTYEFDSYQAVAAVGGKPASFMRAYYMAQIGERHGDDIKWLCDGVLINSEWVLSAAHCFIEPGANPNMLRLGDYDLTQPEEKNFLYIGKYIKDYVLTEVVFHPEFKIKQRYHDLVLIRIPRPYPEYANSINPICLPWDLNSTRNSVGSTVILTGWGATQYGGKKTEVLQEVALEIFNTSTCKKSYSELRDFRRKYPNGMDEETVLCVGWKTDGKDACGGDSGAPIVYDSEPGEQMVLAGIVSGGYGCGIKEYPGIYIPINNPKYLKWINETAFK